MATPQDALQQTFSRNAPRVTQRADGGYDLNEHGNVRPLIGDEVGRAQGYAADFAGKFPTGFQPGVGPQTNAEYDKPPAGPFERRADARYDQWSGPGDVKAGGDMGRVEGFDANNFNDQNMQTAKYQSGRIFSRFDPNSATALAELMADPEFRSLFPGAKAVGPDKIDYGDGRPVDVIRGHGAPGAKWAWQTEDAGAPGATVIGQNPNVSRPQPAGQPGQVGQGQQGQGDYIAQLMDEINAQQPTGQDRLQQYF